MRLLRATSAMMCSAVLCFGCAGVKPYEKEYLLHPLMDETELQSLTTDFPTACASSFERLSMSGVGSGNSTSCPTCGG